MFFLHFFTFIYIYLHFKIFPRVYLPAKIQKVANNKITFFIGESGAQRDRRVERVLVS